MGGFYLVAASLLAVAVALRRLRQVERELAESRARNGESSRPTIRVDLAAAEPAEGQAEAADRVHSAAGAQ